MGIPKLILLFTARVRPCWTHIKKPASINRRGLYSMPLSLLLLYQPNLKNFEALAG
jgi:hypothetical protein